MTQTEFETEITSLTKSHLSGMLNTLGLMADMLGPRGFQRSELVAIVEGVRDAIRLGMHQLDGVGQSARPGAA